MILSLTPLGEKVATSIRGKRSVSSIRKAMREHLSAYVVDDAVFIPALGPLGAYKCITMQRNMVLATTTITATELDELKQMTVGKKPPENMSLYMALKYGKEKQPHFMLVQWEREEGSDAYDKCKLIKATRDTHELAKYMKMFWR